MVKAGDALKRKNLNSLQASSLQRERNERRSLAFCLLLELINWKEPKLLCAQS